MAKAPTVLLLSSSGATRDFIHIFSNGGRNLHGVLENF